MKNDTYKRIYADMQYRRDQVDKAEALLECLPIRLVEQAFPEGVWGNYWLSGFDLDMPMSFPLMQEFREFVELQGWTMTDYNQHVWDNGDAGTFCQVYLDKNDYDKSFHVSFRLKHKGSTCKLQVVGYKQAPVYEVTCADSPNIWEE